MRQGGAPPTGNWIGNPTGGVTAPKPVLLPDARARFAVTAARLDVLAQGHPMAEWLRFMAQLSRAQHVAATTIAIPAAIEASSVERAVAERRPPLDLDSHARDPAWRGTLEALLASLDDGNVPSQPAAAMAELRKAGDGALTGLAGDCLRGTVAPGDSAKAVFVAAALQVYFTLLASRLPQHGVMLLAERGLCPACGSTPVLGIITARGDTPGTRYLYCALCSTAWNHVRAVCTTCGASGKVGLESIEGGTSAVKAETCGDCHTYAKMLYQAEDTQVDAFADDLASLGLDMLVSEAGFARHALNPLLLVG